MNLRHNEPPTPSSHVQSGADLLTLADLNVPAVLRPVSTYLLGSRKRPDGGLDELYHEIPSMDGHKGAVFYISDTPTTDAGKEHPVHQRVLYTMVPQHESEKFVSTLVQIFGLAALPFEDIFTNTFKGELLTEYPKSDG